MKENKYYDFGYNKFGPFLFGFARWLKRELLSSGYEKVFFFSRDGYMMQKAFDLLNDTGIKSEYVYTSRKSLRQPLLYNCTDFEESLAYLSRERYISYGKLLEYYGFDEAEQEDIAKAEGFRLDEAKLYDEIKGDELARHLYKSREAIIRERSQEQDRLLLQYTEQKGMRQRFAIVDVGWHGNMQRYLELFMQRHGLGNEFEGYYLGILPDAKLATGVHGYVYEPERPKMYKKMLCFFGVCEKLLQGFEGSTVGYVSEGEDVLPKLMSYEYEGDRQVVEAIESWQKGALTYVQEAVAHDIDPPDESLCNPLLRFGRKPSLADTKLFSFFYNTDGSKAYYTSQKPLYRYRPKELIRALSDSPWKTGFMKSAFKVPLPYYTVYRLMKK